MANIINDVRNIIASLAGIPLTLESGFNFSVGSWCPAIATRIFMENSPFTINLMPNGGIEVVGRVGWLVRTSRIIHAEHHPNGYCYFLTENGHKYQFTRCGITETVDMLKNAMRGDTEYLRIGIYVKYTKEGFFVIVHEGYEDEENHEIRQEDVTLMTINGKEHNLEEIAELIIASGYTDFLYL